MRIKEITRQVRRDMDMILECEHCGDTCKSSGYDDANYHENVIPKIPCDSCGKTSPENYRPLTTKYPEGFQI